MPKFEYLQFETSQESDLYVEMMSEKFLTELVENLDTLLATNYNLVMVTYNRDVCGSFHSTVSKGWAQKSRFQSCCTCTNSMQNFSLCLKMLILFPTVCSS